MLARILSSQADSQGYDSLKCLYGAFIPLLYCRVRLREEPKSTQRILPPHPRLGRTIYYFYTIGANTRHIDNFLLSSKMVENIFAVCVDSWLEVRSFLVSHGWPDPSLPNSIWRGSRDSNPNLSLQRLDIQSVACCRYTTPLKGLIFGSARAITN